MNLDDNLDARLVYEATWRLIDLTLPAVTGHDIPTQACTDQAQAAADQFADWPTVTWSRDGVQVEASVWWWAGCWVGIVLDSTNVAVVVTGHWMEPENLDLFTVQADDLSYGFDPAAPLEYFDTIATSRDAAFAPDDIVHVPWPRHPDHDRLLGRTR